MNPLSAFIGRHKAYIYALLVILALTSVLSLCYGTYKLGKQTEQLEELATANKLWAEAFDKMNELRKLEHENSVALQKTLNEISSLSHADKQRLKELERTNEEVRALLDTPLHDDLKRLLNN